MTDERHADGGGMQDGDVSTADRALAALLRAQASRPPAPPALRARIEAALSAEVAAAGTGGRAPAPRWLVAAPALAAGVAGLVVAAVAAVTWMALPGAARRLAADTVRETRVAYDRLEARGPAEPVDDAAELSRRLTDALGVPVRVATAAGDGRVRAWGTAPATLFGRDGVAVFFEAGGETVMLTLVPSPTGLPRENRVRIGRGRPFVAATGGTRFVLWRQGPLFCALGGTLPEAQLTALFRALRPGIEVGG